MKKKASVWDFQRKIKIVFYPAANKNLESIKKYFNMQYYDIVGETKFEKIINNFSDDELDLIVCQSHYYILSNAIGKYIYYISEADVNLLSKQTYIDIRKTAYTNYIEKIKKLIFYELRKGKTMNQKVINVLNLLDLKNQYLRDHSIRVMEYAMIIGKSLSLSQTELVKLTYAALLHDMGKIALPSYIISKPKDFTKSEMILFQYHTLIGVYVLNFEELKSILKIIKYHHEFIDGHGYLKRMGDDIPYLAKIIAVADYFDLLTTTNYYNKRYDFQEAIEIIKKNSMPQTNKHCKQLFDCMITEHFIKELSDPKYSFHDNNELLYNRLNAINVEK